MSELTDRAELRAFFNHKNDKQVLIVKSGAVCFSEEYVNYLENIVLKASEVIESELPTHGRADGLGFGGRRLA